MPTDVVRNFIFSLVRTYAPIAAGAILSWVAVNAGIVADEQTKAGLVIVLTVAVQAVYYFFARLLETYVSPKFSFLMADVRKGDSAPVYPDKDDTTVIPPADGGNP